MKIIQWEKHGDVLVGINDQRWKRAGSKSPEPLQTLAMVMGVC